jgi:iron complex outermembrane receptor protein
LLSGAHADTPPSEPIEEVTITTRGESSIALDTRRVQLNERAISANNLLGELTFVPGLDANGQGGDFQTFSIRGVARQRVQTRLINTPIISDRRAGASVSFVDPTLLGTANVILGPASTLYGSGALGGAVQIEPARYGGPVGLLGYASQGDRNVQHLAWGDESWTLGFARRQSFDTETPEGARRFSRFERYSLIARTRQTLGDLAFDLTVVPAIGFDIGKPNTDFPARTTLYPRERHLVVDGTVSVPGKWALSFYAHPNDLKTEVVEPALLTEVENEAIDFGISLGGSRDLPGNVRLETVIAYDARRSVSAYESAWALGSGGVPVGPPTIQQTLSDGLQDELGASAVMRWRPSRFGLEAGVRGAWFRQNARGYAERSDGSASGFLGASALAPWGIELKAGFSSGIRYPSLTESFFSGTTGRGSVVGNPDLESERSINVDGALSWRDERGNISLVMFRNQIDRYIERIEISPGVNSFQNVTSGSIWGIEGEASIVLPARFEFFAQGHWMQGRTDMNDPLADVPPARISTGIQRRAGRIRGELRYQHRFEKTDFASGERAIPGANLLSAEVSLQVWRSIWLGFGIANLTNETYFATADDHAMPEAARSFDVSLEWASRSYGR